MRDLRCLEGDFEDLEDFEEEEEEEDFDLDDDEDFEREGVEDGDKLANKSSSLDLLREERPRSEGERAGEEDLTASKGSVEPPKSGTW